MLVIDETYDNGVAQVRVGDTIGLQLSESPTTGYRWHMQSAAAPALRILADSFEASGGGSGGGGVRFWTIVADQPAVVALKVELKRSWEPTPVKTFNVTIDAKDR